MSDDLVPEEGKQEYHQLLAVLRSSSQRSVPITAGEQTQIITRVQERLTRATSASTLPDDVGVLSPRRWFTPHTPTRQARKSTRFVTDLLAGLVVIGLILGSLALFKAYPFSNGTPVPPSASGAGPTAQTQVGGLEASMRVLIGGPYFLSELLPVDVSLTNHTQRPVVLDGIDRTATLCFSSALLVQVTEGGDPSFSFPKLDVACTQPGFATEVKPGQTLTIRQYVPLTKSGAVTLAMKGGTIEHTASPLDGHWPTVHMQVNPQVPQDRALSLRNQKRQVMIEMPAGAKAHLLYMQTISCESYVDSRGAQWMPLSTNVLDEPTCPTPHPHWEYIVSAPGYSIVSGSQIA
jgi:hypothetical protein